MEITILCSDSNHPINTYLNAWILQNNGLDIKIVRDKSELMSGDFLFLISCSQVIDSGVRSNYKYTLLLHASDLPRGRGWSPYIHEIINGAEYIYLSLLEAEDKVDTGRIWKKIKIKIPNHYLYHEINDVLFKKEIELIDFAINNHREIIPKEQDSSIETTYYKKRNKTDSEINPRLSIAEQFNLLRICDYERYPAFFSINGFKYKIKIEKINDE